jgi:hypothetical protein
MASSKDLIPKTGVRFGPLSGISPENSPFPGSPSQAGFNKARYSLRDVILAGTFSQHLAPVPSIHGRGFSDLELEHEVSYNIAQSLKAGNCRYFEPQGVWVPFEILTRNSVDQDGNRYGVRFADSDTGSNIIQTKVEPSIGDALTPYAATFKAGATVIPDLRSDFAQPVWQNYSSPNGVAENINVVGNPNTIPTPTFALQQMQPIRVNADLLVSRQLVLQSTPGWEDWFRKQVLQAIAAKVDFYVMNGLGPTANQPTGILNYPQNVTNGTLVSKLTTQFTWGGAASYADQVAAVSSVTSQNVSDDGSFAWVISEAADKRWKSIPVISGFPRYLIETHCTPDGARIQLAASGQPVYATTNLDTVTGSSNQCVFGRWSDCLVGFWGAMDIVSNPFSFAESGTILVSVNVLCNFVLLHANAFTISSDSAAQ